MPLRALRRPFFHFQLKDNKQLATKLAKITQTIQNMSDFKPKRHATAKVYGYELLNALSITQAQQLYAIEISMYSKSVAGCILSTRAKQHGGYPRVQLPRPFVPEEFIDKEKSWNEQKGRFKVGVHQLAFRAAGHQVPDYSANCDLMHRCGKGKALIKNDPTRGCISQEHLAPGSHRENMAAQGCMVKATCEWCDLVTCVCTHTPRCISHCADRPKVKSITVTYEDGTVVSKTF